MIEATIQDAVQNIIDRFDEETEREEVIEALDIACDDAWCDLVKYKNVTEYDAHDLVDTAGACAEIIHYADQNAWVEDDSGLWEGLTYGVLASIAYFSLRNCFYQALFNLGYDTNNEYPLRSRTGDG